MKKSSIITIVIISFVISCKQREKKRSFESEKTIQTVNYIKNKNSGESIQAKRIKKVQIVLDTIPPEINNRQLDKYRSNIEKLKKDFPNKNYTTEEIKSIIPINKREFNTYYNLTYSNQKDLEFFDIIDYKIFEYAKKDRKDVFFMILNMVEYVDGEYAESYFSNIEEIIIVNQKKFCSMYKYLSRYGKERFEYLYNEICR